MEKIKKLMQQPRFREVFKFAVNGAICFVIDWSCMMLLDAFVFPKTLHWLSIAIGFTVSVIANYIICVLWVFEDAGKQDLKSKAVFVGSSIMGLGWTELLMWLLEKVMPPFIAKPIVTLLVMVWNYFLKRFAIYGMKK